MYPHSQPHTSMQGAKTLSYSLSMGHLCALKSPCLAVCIVAEVQVALLGHTRTAVVSGRIHRSSLLDGCSQLQKTNALSTSL